MATLVEAGCAVGEYVGDGHGETESSLVEAPTEEVDVTDDDEEEEQSTADDQHPLLVLFDCETTGFSIYNDHIIDIAAKIIASPVPMSQPTFSSLIRTPKNIPKPGT